MQRPARRGRDRLARHPCCTLERTIAAAPGGAAVVVRGGEYPELVVRGGLDRTARLRSEGLVLTDDTTVGAGAHHTLNRR